MRAVALKTPIDVIEPKFIVFSPTKPEQEGGVLTARIETFKFAFGFIDSNPTSTPFAEENELFKVAFGGFEWTCPEEGREAQLNQQITIDDVLKEWEKVKNGGLEDSNVKVLTVEDLNMYFPKEKLLLHRPSSEIVDEQRFLREFTLNKNLFFYDQYEGQWLVNRMDPTKIYMIQVAYNPEKNQLKLKSDVYLMKESLLSCLDDYQDTRMIDLKLIDLIILRNRALELATREPNHVLLNESFAVFPKLSMVEWMNPAKFYFDEVSC